MANVIQTMTAVTNCYLSDTYIVITHFSGLIRHFRNEKETESSGQFCKDFWESATGYRENKLANS